MLVTWPINYSGDTIKVYFEPLPRWWRHESFISNKFSISRVQKRLFLLYREK